MAKAKKKVWWVRGQLQGLHGNHGRHHGIDSDRSGGDDQEALGVREVQEARLEVVVTRAR
jgi:hypothetical protein